MLKTMDNLYIGARIRMTKFVEQFKKDEAGVSSIVATVLLILIVVLLAAVFWKNISKWFNGTWETIFGESGTGAIKADDLKVKAQ